MDEALPAVERAAAAPYRPEAAALPEIPLVDVGAAGPLALFEAERVRAEALLAAGRREYGEPFFGWADRLSRRWLVRSGSAYAGELADLAAASGQPGVYLLNLSYEWFCTSAVAADQAAAGSRMLRTLDWPLSGLGRHVVVARQEGAAGAYFNVTWPGFAGVATAMAPGRFSAALNQAPMRRADRSLVLDWLRNRWRVWQSRGLPPVHLLRRVFDDCRSFAEARARLVETPLCLPAFFVLSGVEAHEGCVIERLEDRAMVHEAPACDANHWLTPGLTGDPRGVESSERLAQMEALHGSAADGLGWVTPPILNTCTRLAAAANAAQATLEVQGWEENGPATAVFRL